MKAMQEVQELDGNRLGVGETSLQQTHHQCDDPDAEHDQRAQHEQGEFRIDPERLRVVDIEGLVEQCANHHQEKTGDNKSEDAIPRHCFECTGAGL